MKQTEPRNVRAFYYFVLALAVIAVLSGYSFEAGFIKFKKNSEASGYVEKIETLNITK